MGAVSTAPMRILLLLRDLDIGGAQQQATLLARSLAALGDQVTVATFYGGGALEQELRNTGVRLAPLAKQGRFDTFGFIGRFRALVRELKPDVVYSFLTVSNLIALSARSLRPRPLIVWGIRASATEMRHYDWLARATHWLEGRLVGRADLVIANAEEGARDAAARGFPADRLVIVPNAVDAERFKPDATARGHTRRAWNVSDATPLIGHAARADPMKDHDTFFAAMRLVRQAKPTAHACCIVPGDESARAALRARLGDAAAYIDIRADDGDMPAAMNAFDVFCSTSAFGEASSNVLAEALACGVPCVATRVGGAEAIVGGAGAIVPPRDPAATAAAILGGLARAPQLHETARARVTDRTPERLALETQRVLREAVAQWR